MSKSVEVYIAMSLDGYVADINGSVDWLQGDGSDKENMGSYLEFYESIDTVILGYITYEQIKTVLSPDNWPYKGKQTYVITHRDIKKEDEIIFTDKLVELIKKLKQEEGKNIWICGGASIINQLITEELVDKYTISVIPKILGDGIQLFNKNSKTHDLKLKETRVYNGIVDLVYEKTSK